MRDLGRGLDFRPRPDTLEGLAERLGVPVTGRHTAPGDAIIAGLIFLELLHKYEVQGVRTVAELLRLQRAARGRR